MTAATLFSGIGAPEHAAPWISWQWSAEIDPFASAVLAHRHPSLPNLGDITHDSFLPRALSLTPPGSLDLIVGGSPCQSFSVAGKRAGVDDPRGVLAFEFIQICSLLRPRWFLFENVPGLLSSGSGRDWPSWLEAASQCGYHVAWRVLDAQYFGVPQRRRRIFAAGYLGDWRPPAAVLFEPESLRGDITAGREAGKETAGTLGGGFGSRGWAPDTDRMTPVPILEAGKRCGAKGDKRDGLGIGEPGDPMFILQSGAQHGVLAFDTTQVTSRANRSNPRPGDPCHPLASGAHAPSVAYDLNAKGGSGRIDGESETFACSSSGNGYWSDGVNAIRSRAQESHEHLVTHSLRAEGFDASEDGTGRGTPLVPVAFTSKDYGSDAGELSPTLRAMTYDGSHANGGGQVGVATAVGIRRLVPRECERLQGFPDGYTLIPVKRVSRSRLRSPRKHRYCEIDGEVWQLAADGPRYRALGNSMAVPAVRWLLTRIAAWDSIVG